MTVAQATAQDFEEHRDLLFGVAYRMLGSAAGAEDIVQDAYLRFRGADRGEIRNLRSFLVTIVTRLCLDELKSARAQRETYVGPWLPEPILTSEADWRLAPEGLVDLRESVSMAFMVMLERLRPIERVVLLLHDVFDYSHAEVATMVGKTEAACRQVLKRAHDRVSEGRQRNVPSLEEHEQLTRHFLQAATTGDVEPFVRMLAPDVVLWSDGGGKVAAALNPIHGADRVRRLFTSGIAGKETVDRIESREVNGQPALLLWSGRRLTNVALTEFDGGQISTVYIMRNPDKLRRMRRALRPSPPDPLSPGVERGS